MSKKIKKNRFRKIELWEIAAEHIAEEIWAKLQELEGDKLDSIEIEYGNHRLQIGFDPSAYIDISEENQTVDVGFQFSNFKKM